MTAEEYLIHAYNRFQIVMEKGEGVYLYDQDGKEYLDFTSGIAVFALGYHNEAYNQALKNQIDQLIHTSNLFYNEPAAKAAQTLCQVSGMDRVFFTNSGAEAIEGAIKLARKYYYKKTGKPEGEIIAMNHSFHGRSMGALSVTGNKKYQEPFGPMLSNIRFAEFNDYESVMNQVTEHTCAILMETVQGEGGLYPANQEFLTKIREFCTKHDILLILDEIQCGMGRTGTMFAYQGYGIVPDIMTTAKALGCGVPVGAFCAVEAVASAMEAGDHGTTYGGNPLVTAAVNKVFELFESEHVVTHVKEVGTYLSERLDQMVEQHKEIIAHRGCGLMQGLEFDGPVIEIIKRAHKSGLIIISAGANVIRFVPPLIITKQHVDDMITILEGCINV